MKAVTYAPVSGGRMGCAISRSRACRAGFRRSVTIFRQRPLQRPGTREDAAGIARRALPAQTQETQKQLSVYTLVVSAKKPTLRPAVSENGATMRPGDGALEFRNTSMEDLAERLASRPLSLDRPVLDRTGLKGGYDFSLNFADNAAGLKGALEDVDRGTGQFIFSVIQSQPGLKLNPQKTSLPALVVEHAVASPGEN